MNRAYEGSLSEGVRYERRYFHAGFGTDLMLDDFAQNGVLEDEQQDHCDHRQHDDSQHPFEETDHWLNRLNKLNGLNELNM